MKNLDRNSQIVLVALLLFFGWILFQWDSTAIDPNATFSSTISTEPIVEPVPVRKEIVPRKGLYVSGFSGSILNTKGEMLSDSLAALEIAKISSFKTSKNSWLSLDLGNSTYLIVFENSRIELKNDEIHVLDGKVYVSNFNSSFKLISQQVRINSSINSSDVTVISESNKVRVFALLNDVEVSAFGKKESLSSSQGASLFLKEKRFSMYSLANGIQINNSNSSKITWSSNNDALAYNLIVSKEIKTENYIQNKRELFVLSNKIKSFENTESYMDFRVFAENKFGSWSSF